MAAIDAGAGTVAVAAAGRRRLGADRCARLRGAGGRSVGETVVANSGQTDGVGTATSVDFGAGSERAELRLWPAPPALFARGRPAQAVRRARDGAHGR